VTQVPRGQRAGKSVSLSWRQMSMKCHDAVVLSSSRNSVSGRIDAAAIAFSIERVSAGRFRILRRVRSDIRSQSVGRYDRDDLMALDEPSQR
jgi:hypothetical protein